MDLSFMPIELLSRCSLAQPLLSTIPNPSSRERPGLPFLKSSGFSILAKNPNFSKSLLPDLFSVLVTILLLIKKTYCNLQIIVKK